MNTNHEPRYNWTIEIVAEREEETGMLVPFIGTHREARAKADRLADGAPYEVRECVLHRRGEISSPNAKMRDVAGSAPPQTF